MNTSEFLFPSELEITPTGIKNVLLIGSCLSESYKFYFSKLFPDIQFEHILFNSVSDLPAGPPQDISSYDFQYIQIPIRSVLGDSIIQFRNFLSDGYVDSLIAKARNTIDVMLDTALTYNKKTQILSFVSTLIIPQGRVAASLNDQFSDRDLVSIVEELNKHLHSAVKRYRNTFIADVDYIANSLGKRYFLNDSIVFYSHGSTYSSEWTDQENYPFWTKPERGRIEELPSLAETYDPRPEEFYHAVFRQMEVLYRIVRQLDMVKLVIFDLDNTFWRGHLIDHYQDGMDWPYFAGWPMGIWEACHHLRARGILISICSKNDFKLVEARWNNAVQLPWVALVDFISPKINWSPKAENVAHIMKEVGLTSKSVVFIDDNPVEREAVKLAFPDIRAIGNNPFHTRRILLWSSATQVPTLTNESTNRETMIRKQIDREAERAVLSRDDFLKGLGCKVTITQIRSMAADGFGRSLELLNKTNQFNTTGKRWSSAEIEEFLNNDGEILSFYVEDKFTKYGLVGVVLIKGTVFVQYVMSCRVLGMEVEASVIRDIVKKRRQQGIRCASFSAEIIETKDNLVCRDVFLKGGFRCVEGTKGKFENNDPAMTDQFGHVTIEWLS